MSKFYIAPSILAADFARLGQEVEDVLNAGADLIHFDVMDNHYVPNLSFGADICKALRNYGITQTIDVHLMASPVTALIEAFAKAGADMITFHPEASLHIDRDISLIKSLGMKAGLAFNPTTSLDYLDYTLENLDLVLIMSVNPGFGGQKFIPTALKKIAQVKERALAINKDIIIQVDGGVNLDNIAAIAEAGANSAVAGNAIFSTQSYVETIAQMRENILAVQK